MMRINNNDSANETSVHIFDDGGMSEPSTADFTTQPAPSVTRQVASDNAQLKIQRDRRKVPRREVKGGAMAVFSSGRGAGTLARVELLDASWTGLGVVSPMEVEPGTAVSVIPEHAMSPRQIGIVVRCEKFNDGWRLGLQCRTQKAVA